MDLLTELWTHSGIFLWIRARLSSVCLELRPVVTSPASRCEEATWPFSEIDWQSRLLWRQLWTDHTTADQLASLEMLRIVRSYYVAWRSAYVGVDLCSALVDHRNYYPCPVTTGDWVLFLSATHTCLFMQASVLLLVGQRPNKCPTYSKIDISKLVRRWIVATGIEREIKMPIRGRGHGHVVQSERSMVEVKDARRPTSFSAGTPPHTVWFSSNTVGNVLLSVAVYTDHVSRCRFLVIFSYKSFFITKPPVLCHLSF